MFAKVVATRSLRNQGSSLLFTFPEEMRAAFVAYGHSDEPRFPRKPSPTLPYFVPLVTRVRGRPYEGVSVCSPIKDTNMTLRFENHVASPRCPGRLITLFGDPKRAIERSNHVVEMPGVALEVARCDDENAYWAHLLFNRGSPIDDCRGLVACKSQIREAVLFLNNGHTIILEDVADVQQIAMKLAPLDSPRSDYVDPDIYAAMREYEAHGKPYGVSFPGGAVTIQATKDCGYTMELVVGGRSALASSAAVAESVALDSRVTRGLDCTEPGVSKLPEEGNIQRIIVRAYRTAN